MKNDFYSIEPDGYGEFTVYGWGFYERGSLLAGQQRKSFMDGYATVAEALSAYPDADVQEGVVSANNSFGHLPGERSARDEEAYFYRDDF